MGSDVNRRLFVDTCFIVALVNRRDQYHAQALALATQYEGWPLLVTDAVTQVLTVDQHFAQAGFECLLQEIA